MLLWKLLKHHIWPVNQNLSSVYFSLAKFQRMSCNLSHAMIWQMRCTHKLPKLCSATLSSTFFERRTSTESELFFSFDMRWRYQICVVKCLYSYRDDLPKILFKITAQVCKKSFLLDVRRSKKSLLRLPGLLFRIQRRAIFVWPRKMVSVSVPYLFIY